MNFGVSHFSSFLAIAIAWSLLQNCACGSWVLLAELSSAFRLDVDVVEVLAALCCCFLRNACVCGTIYYEISDEMI